MLGRIRELGEEQVARLANQLMNNEQFVETIQNVLAKAFKTREGLEATARFALTSLNIPTLGDLERVLDKLDELEELLDTVESRIAHLESALDKAGER